MYENTEKCPEVFVDLPKRTDADTELIVRHIRWRSEFESHLAFLAHICNPEITNVMIVWSNCTDDLDADFKAARHAHIYRGAESQIVNVECDSPKSIVADIWMYIA